MFLLISVVCALIQPFYSQTADSSSQQDELAFSDEEYTTRQTPTGALSYTYSNCNFTNCTGSDNGGALYLSVSNESTTSLNLTGCIFTNCSTTSGSGGALYVCGSTLVLTGCQFAACTSSTNGGAIYISVSSFNATGSGFANCTAHTGGAAYIDAVNSTVTACFFFLCICSGNDSSGGACYFTTSSEYLAAGQARTLEMLQCSFDSCMVLSQIDAYGGGMMYATTSDATLTATITATSFHYCTAQASSGQAVGGGLAFQFNNNETVTLNGTTFSGCRSFTHSLAGVGGGIGWGVLNQSAQFDQTTWIYNSTFSDNSAAYGSDLAILSDHDAITTSVFDSDSTTSSTRANRVDYLHLTLSDSTYTLDNITNCNDWLPQVEPSSSSSTTTIIVVVVVVVVVVVAAVVCFLLCFCCKRNKNQQPAGATHDDISSA